MATAVNGWSFILLFAYLSIALLLATFLRKQFLFLQRLMIPNAIIAGLIVLLCSGQLFGIIQISLDQLNLTVYHLITGIFILIGLREPRCKDNRAVFTTTMIIGQGYALLAVVGCLFTLIWIGVLFPNFYPSFSMLPLLGFGFDQIIAAGIGLQWEQVGFIGGGRAGFSFGVMGLFWAYLGGTIMVLWLRKRQQKNGLVNSISREAQEGIIPRESEKPAGGYLATAPEAMESLTLHLALIGFLYLIAFSGTNQLSAWLAQFGNVGQLLGEFLWSYNFLIGLLLGYLGRIVINWLELGYLFDSGTMQRISGAMVDYMITAALAAVPLLIYVDYWPEVVILSLISGVAVVLFVYFTSYKMHTDHHLTRCVSTFGYLTGTIASGLALLRMVDPELESPAAEDLACAGGLSLLIGLPLFVLINYPLYGADRPLPSLLITLSLFAGYGLLLFLIWFFWNRRIGKSKNSVHSTADSQGPTP